MEKNVSKTIKLKDNKNETMEAEVSGVMNAIKDDQIKSGVIPKTPSIVVNNFAGKVLKIDKSVVFKGRQFFLKKGTAWEDVDVFFRKHLSFARKDFK